jgi:hypothetical protein
MDVFCPNQSQAPNGTVMNYYEAWILYWPQN